MLSRHESERQFQVMSTMHKCVQCYLTGQLTNHNILCFSQRDLEKQLVKARYIAFKSYFY